MAVEFYLLIKAENLQCKFTEVTEEHVAKILQFIIILFLHQKIICLQEPQGSLRLGPSINDHVKNTMTSTWL